MFFKPIFFCCQWHPGGWLLSFASSKESNLRKGDPGLPRLRRTLASLQIAGLRNSHDSLCGCSIQCWLSQLLCYLFRRNCCSAVNCNTFSPNCTAIFGLSSVARRGTGGT